MRKINLVTSQGKKQMCCTELIVLSESHYEKLTDDCFAGRIDAIAKDLHIDWSIDVTSNANVINISRTTVNVIDDAFCHDLEIASANFMSAIDKLEYDKKEPECPSHKSNKINDLEFVKELLNDINLPLDNDSHVCGALIIDATTHPLLIEPTCWGHLSYDTLKEMCELYIKAHE